MSAFIAMLRLYITSKIKLAKLKKQKIRNRLNRWKHNKLEKKLKRRITFSKAAMIVTIIAACMPAIIAGIVLTLSIVYFGSTATISLLDKEELAKEEEENYYWDFGENKKQPQANNSGNLISGSGGIYPKDEKLKKRAQLCEIITKCCEMTKEATGEDVDPAYIMGIIYRESSNTIYNLMDSNSNKDLFKDLYIPQPPCCKAEGKRTWISNATSHFKNGSVQGGKDLGDAYTDEINDSMALYDSFDRDANGKLKNGGHAIGFVQYEVPYVYSWVKYVYAIGKHEEVEKAIESSKIRTHMDTELGFIRPNLFYIPDALYNCVRGHTRPELITEVKKKFGSEWTTLWSQVEQLNIEDRNFIYFVVQADAYGHGNANHYMILEMIKQLMKVAQSGQRLDNMLMNNGKSYYSKKTKAPQGNKYEAMAYFKNTYGINLEYTQDDGKYNNGEWLYNGIYAACVGRIAWDEMQKEINGAEKDETTGTGGKVPVVMGDIVQGRFIDYVGSGKFAPPTTIKDEHYWSEKSSCFMHRQSDNRPNSEKYVNTTMAMSSLAAPGNTLRSGGCGIYSLSFIAMNLLGDESITPKYLLDYIKSNYPSEILTCLSDAGVPILANYAGLDCKKIYIDKMRSNPTQAFIDELNQGRLVLGVWYNKFKWYDLVGSSYGHFMVVKGYNKEKFEKGNKTCLRGYSSTGVPSNTTDKNNAWDLDDIPEISGEELINNSKRSYFWSIGLKGATESKPLGGGR